MNRVGTQHPVEMAVEWLAPIPLALAVGWASERLGLSLPVAIASGFAVLVAGFFVLKLSGGDPAARVHRFQPAPIESVEPDELMLDERDAVLELHDRLHEPAPDSRVVRLFVRQEPTPGELVDRIVDFLAEGRVTETRQRPAEARPIPDASAALHEALANIRASLR